MTDQAARRETAGTSHRMDLLLVGSGLMNVTPRQSRGQRRNRMATFTINEDNNITAFTGTEEGAQAGDATATKFDSQAALAKI